MLTTRVTPVQKAGRQTWIPIDIFSSLFPLHFAKRIRKSMGSAKIVNVSVTDWCQRNRVIYIIVHHHRSYSTSTSSSPSSLSQTRRQSTLVTPISSDFFGRPKQFHFRRVLNITFAFPGKRSAAMQTSRGASFPSSNSTSYVAMIWANSAFTSLTAKNRPGLIPNSNESRQGP